MKIAHLILCHSNPNQLSRLVKRLMHEDAHFYIHLDKKTDIAPFLFLAEMPRVFFVKKREKVYWGSYSIVQATLNGFEEILDSDITYGYINLLSGQDYSLKSTQAIHDFFKQNQGKAFMHFLSVEDEWQEAIPRITKYHLTDYNFPGRHKVERWMSAIMPKRKFPLSLAPMGRSQWFTIAPHFAAYILAYLKREPKLAQFFKLTWAPDEMIFQTILYNSPLKSDMVNDNFRYIDWPAGKASPKTLTMADAGNLLASGKLFGRKFSPDVDNEILDLLDKTGSI
jgi:hypothetical protein